MFIRITRTINDAYTFFYDRTSVCVCVLMVVANADDRRLVAYKIVYEFFQVSARSPHRISQIN